MNGLDEGQQELLKNGVKWIMICFAVFQIALAAINGQWVGAAMLMMVYYAGVIVGGIADEPKAPANPL